MTRRERAGALINEELSSEERSECLDRMSRASDRFYINAVACGNHAFIEFTGLMNEYIKVCREAHERGVNFTIASVHSGKRLDYKANHVEYLAEKLDCIFGPEILERVTLVLAAKKRKQR